MRAARTAKETSVVYQLLYDRLAAIIAKYGQPVASGAHELFAAARANR